MIKKITILVFILHSIFAYAQKTKISNPFDTFLSGVYSHDTDKLISSFSEDAIVIDVGRKIVGKKEIQKWAKSEIIDAGLVYKILSQNSKKENLQEYIIHISSKSFTFKARYLIQTENEKIIKAVLEYAD
ncbi:MAG TPA: hypothetical protein PK079_17740 [Leptospiraceae bacterium]|nr:hypothetical protein [Leptospiraceae bacterium]HMW06809.1 hypothetical protein [Leptospiraceae bacterium]HMX32174.1 hypothetical protein [Leptospiraceae bacterium]HMY32244.1 hypothetical protein [Leptospiraceae bacterium]HMZ63934.1 hypothetical protein [Leptospiraceae bacterium]